MDTLCIRNASERVMPNVKLSYGDGYLKDNGEATIFAIVYLKRKKVRFNTGVSVSQEYYDDETGTVLRTHPRASDFNLLISNTKARLNDIFVRYRLQYEQLTPTLLRKEYENYSKSLNFLLFLELAIEERHGELSESSLKQHKVLLSKLRKFSPGLAFSEIDEEFIQKFNRWLINTEKNNTNTRANTFKNLKTYLNIAKRQKLIQRNPLETFIPVKKVQSETLFLTEPEVRKLKDLYHRDFLNPTDQIILRHFLFMCFTGLRISDLKAIEMQDIAKGMLIFTAYKTRTRKPSATKIPLCKFAQELIKDESPHRIYGNIFNCYSEQTMRKRIKEIVKVEKITKNLSLHTARHTFATMFLRRTKNLAVLQKLMGHTKIEMTMIYAHVLTEDVEEEVHKAFDDF